MGRASVAKLMRVHFELKARSDPSACHHLCEAGGRERVAALAGEYYRTRLFWPQRIQGSQVLAAQWIVAAQAALGPADVHRGISAATNVIPGEPAQLARPEPVVPGQLDHEGIPLAVAIATRGLDELTQLFIA